MKKYENRTRSNILEKQSTDYQRKYSHRKSSTSSAASTTSISKAKIKSVSRSRSSSSRTFVLGADNLSENHLNDRNFRKFHWTWKYRRALIIDDCRTSIRSDALHFKFSLTSVEFVGQTSCVNVRNLLTTCPHIHWLIFNNVSLIYLSTDTRFPIITLNNLQELKFCSSFPGITPHEYYLVEWFYKRVRILSLQSISFEQKSSIVDSTPTPSSASASASTANAIQSSNRNIGIGTSVSSSVQPQHRSKKTASAIGNDSTITRNTLRNPQSTRRIQFILSNFLLKYAATLKSLEVRRSSGVFIFDENNERLSTISTIQLEKFSSNMRNEGFDKILSVQKSLQAIHCYYNGQVNPKAFKRLFSTIATNLNHIREIVIAKQPEYAAATAKTITATAGSEHTNQYQFNSMIPELVNHDFKIYEKCANLKKLNIDSSSTSSNLIMATGRPYTSPSSLTGGARRQSTISHNNPPNSYVPFGGGLINLHLIPASIRSLILRFDFISESQMTQLAHRFHDLVNLMFFVMHGHPDRPFKMTLEWASLLIDLENLMLFEFHFCDFKEIDNVTTFIRARPQMYCSKFEATSESIIYWRKNNNNERNTNNVESHQTSRGIWSSADTHDV